MFKKLIANLPFNPSLLGQVSFYAKRLHQEESIRRIGFGFMALAMFIQVFAVITPPQKSLAYSNDYIINGLKTRDDILRAWDGGTSDKDVAQIYGKFGLTRQDIEALPMNPNVTINSNQADFWTIGRTSLSAVSKAGQIKQEYKDNEVPINYGGGVVYLRRLKAWDIINTVNYYQAFQGMKDGVPYYILVDCGNFTISGTPTPETPPETPAVPNNPALEFRKTIDGGAGQALKPGSQFTFRFEYRNSVQNSKPVIGAIITDTLDLDHFDIVSSNPAELSIKDKVLRLRPGRDIQYTDGWQLAATITVRIKDNIPNGTSICNAATMTASNAPAVSSGGSSLCVNVINPCPLDGSIGSATDPRCVTPALVCSLTQSEINRTTKESTLKTTVTTSNPALTHVVSYTYDFGDKTSKTNNSSALTDTVKHVYKDGKYTAKVIVSYKIGDGKGAMNTTVACTADVETKPDQPLTPSKTAQNITQKLSEADTLKTKANGGDVIEYVTNTRNSYNYDRTNYTVTDSVGDILDYADIDITYLERFGGKFDTTTKTVTWANQTVKANSDLALKFRVTIKNPIPATNQPGAMTTSFDCVISNKYGSEIAIPVNCPAVKNAEYIATTLPNTGPGTSIMIGGVLTIVIGYFFARSRVLGKELELVRAEYAAGGGF